MASYDLSAASMDQQLMIEMIWTSALGDLRNGCNEIVITTEMQALIGQQGIAAIADRFSSLIHTRASVLHDSSLNIIRILPPPMNSLVPVALAATPTITPSEKRVATNAKSKLAKDRVAKIPRPPNAFILYRQDQHPLIKNEHPDIHNNQISVIVGNMWKNEKVEVKELYKKKAADVKQKHVADHPEYQYQPRKPADKKKRATKRNNLKLAMSESHMNTAHNAQASLSEFATPEAADNHYDFNEIMQNIDFDAAFTDDYTLPNEIPDFEPYGSSGLAGYYEFESDTHQPRLFDAMIEQQNARVAASPGYNSLAPFSHIAPTVLAISPSSGANGYASAQVQQNLAFHAHMQGLQGPAMQSVNNLLQLDAAQPSLPANYPNVAVHIAAQNVGQ